MDDGPEPVRDFYQRFKMNYPVVMGNAQTGELYGGVLGLPIAFLIGRDGRISAKHIGATDISVFEKEIVKLLPKQRLVPSSSLASLAMTTVGCFLRPCVRSQQVPSCAVRPPSRGQGPLRVIFGTARPLP